MRVNQTLSVFVLISLFSLVSSGPVQAKRFTLNLDLPPEERWNEIIKDYTEYASVLTKDIRKRFPKELLPLVDKLVTNMDQSFPAPFAGEMRGIAKTFRLNVTEIILLNVIYDISAYCTSIVAQDRKGNIFLARNLDYDFSNTLRKITFIVDFMSKGEIIYSGVTMAGMVGLFTAQKPNALTIDLDERDKGYLWENIIIALLNKKAVPVSFEIRKIVSTEGMDFQRAIHELSTVSLIADCYYIVGGIKPEQGVVVTRNRLSTADVWRLDAAKGRWFLVETNYDHWTSPPPSDDRRDPAIKALTSIGQENINATTLFQVLNQHPVLNSHTIFTAIMEANNPGLLNAWVQELDKN
ncbi:N-acylethanolamine-hydrolyzing acid amidase [Nematostella vectensis]|uniref:N-acylethanolamine-hydrolyzing acid amidase n=1 Tax=Nematostella vectensis TaxID=45351 RepID=UPI0020776F7D|nr:N-acylethanolamine-hydrolyzing acid amidase [Nematostella vectensis]